MLVLTRRKKEAIIVRGLYEQDLKISYIGISPVCQECKYVFEISAPGFQPKYVKKLWNEEIRLADKVVIKILAARRNFVKLGISAPPDIKIFREEIL
jgi:sRNA-binding carbon storage regulator CsrA